MSKLNPTVKPTLIKVFEGYSVKRTVSQISFGCGAVKVDKADLRTLAAGLENKTLAKNLSIVAPFLDLNGRLVIGANTANAAVGAKAFTNVIKTAEGRAALISLANLRSRANGYRSFSQILSIPPTTLRRLIGGQK